jgi:hypothetical protein
MSCESSGNPLCDDCGQPLFLDKEECQEFIEGKLKQGYFICSCCGMTRTLEKD